jgi:Tfp pilus assembly protein PilO
MREVMEVTALWNAIITLALGIIGYLIKGQLDEIKRVTILLNKTREEVAKEYVTKAEVHADINRVISKMDAMDAKFDRLLERMSK